VNEAWAVFDMFKLENRSLKTVRCLLCDPPVKAYKLRCRLKRDIFIEFGEAGEEVVDSGRSSRSHCEEQGRHCASSRG
jgi:hypothetical protein